MISAKPTGLGVSAELERAIARSAMLDYGERLMIPAGEPDDAKRMRQYFYRQRARAIKEALASGSTIDASEADPWRGLVAEIVHYGSTESFFLQIRRPPKLTEVVVIKADGKHETESLQ